MKRYWGLFFLLVFTQKLQCADDAKALVEASAADNRAEVIRLLKANVHVDSVVGENDQTALHVAAQRGRESIVEILISPQFKADVNKIDKKKCTALHWAATMGVSEGVVESLLDHGAEVDPLDDTGRTPLCDAASECGSADIIETLVYAGAAIDGVANEGGQQKNPLLYAARNLQVGAAATLLAHNADVNFRGGNQSGVLDQVFNRGEDPNGDVDKMCALFVRYGADVQTPDADGTTPLHQAAYWGYQNAVELLLANNADPSTPDEDGVTPLDFARSEDQAGIVALLEAAVAQNR